MGIQKRDELGWCTKNYVSVWIKKKITNQCINKHCAQMDGQVVRADGTWNVATSTWYVLGSFGKN